jgi:homoserine dehydrogenase
MLVGFGIVGQSFAKLLLASCPELYGRYGIKPRLVACVDNQGGAFCESGLNLQRLLEVKRSKGTVGAYFKVDSNAKTNILQMIENVDSEILVDVTTTNLEHGEPATSHIIAGMRSGKHIITVNKGPLALAFPSLIELANYNNVMLRFSGTVGGGTPILDFAKRCLKGDRIISFMGILNGTTNYILSKMEDGLTFENALCDAKQKGYAEAVPSLDIEGYDAAAKLVIMANWITGMKVTMKDVKRSGIGGIRCSDILKAQKKGHAIKLIATCDHNHLNVEPTEISKRDPIYVNGTLNAVTFFSEHSGQQTIIGHGAGGMETASAIIRDLIEIKETAFR